MNQIKAFLVFFAFVSFPFLGTAQNDVTQKQAEEKVLEINGAIVSTNPDLALSPEQVNRVLELHLKRSAIIRESRKSSESKEKKTETMYAAILYFNQQVNHYVLNKAQFKAKRKAMRKARTEAKKLSAVSGQHQD